jgi:hypothetical protein
MVLFAFNVVLLVAGILAARPRMLPAADPPSGGADQAPAPPPASPPAADAA